VAELGEHIRILIPPHVTAVLSDGYGWNRRPIELYYNRRAASNGRMTSLAHAGDHNGPQQATTPRDVIV
jgi:hypothetical protein